MSDARGIELNASTRQRLVICCPPVKEGGGSDGQARVAAGEMARQPATCVAGKTLAYLIKA